MVQTYMALNHYKGTLMYNTFTALRKAPKLTKFVLLLASLQKKSILRPTFSILKTNLCQQEQAIERFKAYREIELVQRSLQAWNSICV